MGDELFPRKDGQLMTSDIDYVDVWRVRTCELFVCIYSSAHPSTITVFVDVLHLCGHLTCFCCYFVSLSGIYSWWLDTVLVVMLHLWDCLTLL